LLWTNLLIAEKIECTNILYETLEFYALDLNLYLTQYKCPFYLLYETLEFYALDLNLYLTQYKCSFYLFDDSALCI
jgi:hypothetical protein